MESKQPLKKEYLEEMLEKASDTYDILDRERLELDDEIDNIQKEHKFLSLLEKAIYYSCNEIELEFDIPIEELPETVKVEWEVLSDKLDKIQRKKIELEILIKCYTKYFDKLEYKLLEVNERIKKLETDLNDLCDYSKPVDLRVDGFMSKPKQGVTPSPSGLSRVPVDSMIKTKSLCEMWPIKDNQKRWDKIISYFIVAMFLWLFALPLLFIDFTFWSILCVIMGFVFIWKAFSLYFKVFW